MLTEREAAALLGWTPANLRSHRERHEAWLLAESLDREQREAVLRLSRDRGAAAEPRALAGRRNLLRPLDEPRAHAGCGEPHRVELTQLGLEVARRLRQGGRDLIPPESIRTPGGRRYRRSVLEDWARAHPEILRASEIAAQTLTTEEAAAFLGLQVTTLRSFRSKATRAQRRLDADLGTKKEQAADRRTIRRAPPWVLAGAEKRYREVDLRAWLARRDRDPDPMVEPMPIPPGVLLSEEEACAKIGIKPQCLAGYRSRARVSIRWLADHEGRAVAPEVRRSHEYRALCCPQHVEHKGERWYRAVTLRRWAEAKRKLGDQE